MDSNQKPSSQATTSSTPAQAPRPTSNDDALKYVIPINRSGLSIAAGYVGLFSILLFPAPIALILGLLALRDLKRKPNLLGKGRAWFAIVIGGVFTLLMLIIAVINGI